MLIIFYLLVPLSVAGRMESITSDQIRQKVAVTAADALDGATGLSAQSINGGFSAASLSLNGFQGMRNTLTIDGIPLVSPTASAFALEAIPAVGIRKIEVERGGFAFNSSDAIGGTVNIVTTTPVENAATLDTSAGIHGYDNHTMHLESVTQEGRTRAVFAALVYDLDPYDTDKNRVAEAPKKRNESFFIKYSRDITPQDTLDFRYGYFYLDILGGTVAGARPTKPRPINPGDRPLFHADDVGAMYIDDQNKISDVIEITRQDYTAKWTHKPNRGFSASLLSAVSENFQDSIYAKGFDTNSRELLWISDLQFDFRVNDGNNQVQNRLLAGVDYRQDGFGSVSERLKERWNLIRDDYKHQKTGLYFADTLVVSEELTLYGGIRGDWFNTKWLDPRTDLQYSGKTVEKIKVLPHFGMTLNHGEHTTSEIGYRKSYRQPLSFIENMNGLRENGILIDLKDLEQADSYSYAFNYKLEDFKVIASTHYTLLTNMAYVESDVVPGSPPVMQQYPATVNTWSTDFSAEYRLTPGFLMGSGFENHALDNQYKKMMGVAAIEKRARLLAEANTGGWAFSSTLTWVAARNLSLYGYDRHYQNIISDSRKWQRAPSFFILDFAFTGKISRYFAVSGGVKNIFDFTQTGKGDSPLNWRKVGSTPVDFDLDQGHVWGPNTGRVWHLGLTARI